jgi:hypothetical protein
MGTDRVFLQFAAGLFLLIGLYGITMTVVVVWGDHSLALKLINVWATMFGALVGLGSGYLIGRSTIHHDNTPQNRIEEETEVLPPHGYPQRPEQ